jgi:class 3 adenylate cyclase/tetratricopeptide (TPR) repeat protein
VPYEELPDSEKEYDRKLALETIKALVARGYLITAASKQPLAAPTEVECEAADLMERLEDAAPMDISALMAIWKARDPGRWAETPEIYQRLGERILRVGEPLMAYDVLAQGLECRPEDVRLRQLLALALARSGATLRANSILSGLVDEGQTDGETLGILARTHKDLGRMASDPTEGKGHLEKAHRTYANAFSLALERGDLDDAIYTGINTASTAVFIGDKELAQGLARKVCLICHERLQERDDYWAMASLGEAAVILGEWTDAEDWYSKAAHLLKGNFADLSSTRRQARILLESLGHDKHRFDHCFGIPRIVVFAGHMVDHAHRPRPRFPQSLEEQVRRAVALKLKDLDAHIGYSSAACGSDILFLEEMLRRQGEINIVLPLPPDQFERRSVDIIPGYDWKKRFRELIERATRVMVVGEHHSQKNDAVYEYSNLMMTGLAVLRSQILDTELTPVAVWDGRPGDGPGGTASLVESWRVRGLAPRVIDLGSLARGEAGAKEMSPDGQGPALKASSPGPSELPQKIMAMLFADVVGYSGLSEREIPRFVKYFMGTIADLVNASSHKPVMKNTWGDALYFVFPTVGSAGSFALELKDCLSSIDWARKGLPKNLNLRIALHAGPVYYCRDPVTGTDDYIGSHVNWAARIEPVTPPGQVYASQAFAALASAQAAENLRCEYVGQIPLAKGYGIFPTYHVHRQGPG